MPLRAVAVPILLCACAGLFAQTKNPSTPRGAEDINTRTLEGVVTNRAKQPVANAVVQLENMKTLQIRSFVTSDDGKYHFAGLGSDVEYKVKADHDGVTSAWKTLSVFNTKKTPVINLRLKK